MSRAVSHACDEHPEQFDCPDALVYFNEEFREYGLIVHDGGTSYVVIGFCPWCGTFLPKSTRQAQSVEAPPAAPPVKAPVEVPVGAPVGVPVEVPAEEIEKVEALDELELPPQISPGPPPPAEPEPPAPAPPAPRYVAPETAAPAPRMPAEPPFVERRRPVPDPAFVDAIAALRRGDFSQLEPLFQPPSGAFAPDVVRWHAEGRFTDEPDALDEALTCASFLGYVDVVRYFLKQGVNASGGAATGMNALHWAANRGQLDVVDALLKARAPWTSKSSYGGNVLDTAVWSAIHEPRPVHQAIVILLLKAGAVPEDQQFPTGHAAIDGLLRQYGRT